MVLGFYSPFGFTYMADMTPAKNRGKYMSSYGLNYIFGEIITSVIALITLTSLDSGDWRALLIWSLAPSIFALILSTVFLEESARFEMSKGRYESGINLLKRIFRMGNKNEEIELLTLEEEQKLIENSKKLYQLKDNKSNDVVHLKNLLKGRYKYITPVCWFTWFVNTLTYNGVTFILPSVLSALNQGGNNNDNSEDFDIMSISYSCVSELIPILISIVIVDTKIFGRKNTMIISFFAGGLTFCLSSLQVAPGLVFWISAAKTFVGFAWSINYQFTSEIYPTVLRGRGVGISASVGKFGSIIMPYIGSLLFKVDVLLPFYMFGGLNILAGILTLSLPFDTAGVKADDINKAGRN
jgi:Sugar (and other) transporter